MSAKRTAFAVVALTLSFAARAGAQGRAGAQERADTEEPDPSVESDTDETVPGDVPPSDAVPPVETAPGPPPGQAPPPDADAGFGSAGQLTISSDLELLATRTSTEGQSGHLTQIRVTPAVDYFALSSLSIGGQLIIGYNSIDTGEKDSAVELGLLVRVGYNIPFSPMVSLWPRVAIGYRHVSGAVSLGPSDSSISAAPFQLYVPVVVQLVPHFFLGGGPIVTADLFYEAEGVYGPKQTMIGLQSTLGGYFRAF